MALLTGVSGLALTMLLPVLFCASFLPCYLCALLMLGQLVAMMQSCCHVSTGG